MRTDFGVFILSHGRPVEVETTIGSLQKAGYSGRWWIVLDDEDTTRDEYAARWGEERLLVFSKDEVALEHDLGDNRDGPRGVIFYARNATERFAQELGLAYYQQLDDDYTSLLHRVPVDGKLTGPWTRHYDDVVDAFIDLLDSSPHVLTVAFAQGGDLMGGMSPSSYFWRQVLRKAMNTFIVRTGRPVRFVGRINEDVNTYAWRGTQGEVFLTITDFAIVQRRTQEQGGGMTGAYLDAGTYVKSFYTVMYAPSCVKISTLGETSVRVHHHIAANNAYPKIVSSSYRRSS